MNSGPLFYRMYVGTPRKMNRSVRASITSLEFSFRFTLIAKHSRLCSSKMLSIRNALARIKKPASIETLVAALMRGAIQIGSEMNDATCRFIEVLAVN